MAIQTYQGESHKLNVEIKDGNGTVVSPSSFYNVIVFIVHRISMEVIAKYSLLTLTGYTTATINGDYVVCILNASQSQEAQQGLYEAQVDLYISDVEYEDGYKILRQKGILMLLNPATNG